MSRKKRARRDSCPPRPAPATHRLDPDLVARQAAMVQEILQVGRTPPQALDLAMQAWIFAEHLIRLVETHNPLPHPIACQAGCHFCCFNQVEVSPPEALLLGHYLKRQLPSAELAALRERLAAALTRKAGLSKVALAAQRQDLPCPLLLDGHCRVHPVRPLVCRAMHALEARECREALASRDRTPVAYYAHRHDLFHSVAQGLRQGCRQAGLAAPALDLPQALEDFFRSPTPIESWLQGEPVFTAA